MFFKKRNLLVLAAFLFLLSFIFSAYFARQSSIAGDRKLLQSFLHAQQKDFNSFLKDTGLIRKLVHKQESLEEFKKVANREYGIYIYDQPISGGHKMVFWSNQIIVPREESFYQPDGEYFHRLLNGYYLTVKKTIFLPAIQEWYIVFAMIPVRYNYFIETDYMHQQFTFSKDADERIRISDAETNFPVESLSGVTLFYLEKKINRSADYENNLTMALRITALILLLMFVHFVAEKVAKKRGVWMGVTLLATSIIALRLIIYFFPVVLNLRQYELFDPTIYGSNFILRSLGDLLINSLLVCWIVLFAWSKLGNHKFEISNPALKRTIGITALFFLILSTFTLAGVIRSLISDSKISFDVTNFFSLTIYSVVGFVVLASLSLAYYYFTQILFHFIFPVFEKRAVLIYFVMALTGLIYLTIRLGDPLVQFYIPVLLWLVIYTWLVSQKGFVINRFRVNIAGILFWIFVFSVSISAIILFENKTKEWQMRKSMAEKVAMENDPTNEKQISIALTYLDNDFLLNNFYRFRDKMNGRFLKDSIINNSYRGYINKYQTKLYVFDEDNKGLDNEDLTSYEALNTILTMQARATDVNDLYYYEKSNNQYTYITHREVVDSVSGHKIGSIFIISNPKNYSSDALTPELFKQMKQTDYENSPVYSSAFYTNELLVSPSNQYPFSTRLNAGEIPVREVEKRQNGGFDELWYKASNDKVVVVARKRGSFIETITLFSYIFCAFLFMVAIFQMASIILKTVYDRRQLGKLWQMNIRTQVHSTIILISVLSFTIIGVATISFFIARFKSNNRDKLSRTMRIMVNEMQIKLADLKIFDDVVKIYDSVSNLKLRKLIEEVAQIHDVDINVYDLEGTLQVTSADNIYHKGVLSKKMHPQAYYHLSRLRQIRHVQEETAAELSYLSIYAPVRDGEGGVYAYLNIPYFTSIRDLNQEISNFLVTIINLNAFIFLIAGVIALFITNRITRSFSIISDKMKEVNLGKLNEEIEWNRDDEIGELVKEYNKMVTKLEESAFALAKSEREGAWKEMARQVAHEIKNPLTPMKLSIQYLQKAVANNQPNVKELTGNVARTLVEQIDHLSKIAADFAQFANIDYITIERFDLHDVISSLQDLYKHNYKIDFTCVRMFICQSLPNCLRS